MIDFTAVPEHLLGPLLDSAAATLRALPPTDVPVSLRPLVGFDPRGLTRGPARLQLRRALESDAQFREQTFAVFSDRPEVPVVLGGWNPADALAIANAAAEGDGLALLASALVATEAPGAEFGLGVVVAVDAARGHAGAQAAQADAIVRRIADLEEGLRRLEVARAELERERDVLAEQLRVERRARRERERERDDRAAADAARAASRIVELEGEVARECSRAERAEAERERAVARGERSEIERARALARWEQSEAERADAIVRVDALAAELQALREAAASDTGTSAQSAESSPARAAAPGSLRRRARPSLPGGLFADSPSGAEAMLRSRPVLLVVDGYNVSKSAGPSASLSVERESLVRSLEGLQLTSGAEVQVVFDGDGTPAFSKANRRGVRVVFSPAGEEADSVVVEIVASTPLQTPVVVASSDRWVREHAEAFGAVAISAATLLAVLRKAPGRSPS
jgi:predicted RNA-binding protein with PIN domain